MASENSNQPASGGIGFTGLLQLLFIALKLTHYVTWSWPVVLLPTIIPLIILFLFLIGVFIYALVKS